MTLWDQFHPSNSPRMISNIWSLFSAFLAVVQELYLENNLIEEISETVFNQTQNLNIVSLRHNRLDETRIAPMAWFSHRSVKKKVVTRSNYSSA